MREIVILFFGIVFGIAIQRMAGETVDRLVEKSVAAAKAFQDAE